jgi:hypothetical protein
LLRPLDEKAAYAFSDWHAQGCALRVFVMRQSIGRVVAAQQNNAFDKVKQKTYLPQGYSRASPSTIIAVPRQAKRLGFRQNSPPC